MKRKSSKEIEIRRVEAKGRYDEREEESNNGRRERERKIEELSKSALKTDLRSILDRLNEKARNEREKMVPIRNTRPHSNTIQTVLI